MGNLGKQEPPTSYDASLSVSALGTFEHWYGVTIVDENIPERSFFIAGALYREFRELMRILTTFLEKTHRNPS